jgi:hypothetical protein
LPHPCQRRKKRAADLKIPLKIKAIDVIVYSINKSTITQRNKPQHNRGGVIMALKEIPQIAATLQVALYLSHTVPEYKNLSLDERRKKVEEDYFTSLKIADVIFEEAKHKKLPPQKERIAKKYI